MAVMNSPLWWLETLYGQMISREAELTLFDDYYSGNHPLPFLTRSHNAKMRDEFRRLIDDSRSNFMRLVVDAVEERLVVDGFSLASDSTSTQDDRAWEIWQSNNMDAESQAAFLESLIMGVSYVSVWGQRDAMPTLAIEDPRQTIVGYEPGTNFRARAAALKVWNDEWTGDQRANVYLPGGIYKYERTAKSVAAAGAVRPEGTFDGPSDPVRRSDAAQAGWEPIAEGSFVKNPTGVVPIIPIRNRPRLLLEGESELADTYRIQNQINGLLFLLALAGYFGAHRQRWAVGLKLMENENGDPVEPYDVAIDRLLISENPGVQFGEFSQTSLDGYISAIEQKVLHIAVTTRTPRHYLVQAGQSPSGDAIKSAESGLVKKVERKQRPFGEALEEAIRLARIFAGETDAPADSEVVWADASTPTEAETTDAVIKQHGAGLIPWEAALAKLGYTQTEIDKFRPMREADAKIVAAARTAALATGGAPVLVPPVDQPLV